MDERIKNIFKKEFQNSKIFFNEPLSLHLAWKVGGIADILIYVRDEKELIRICMLTKKYNIPLVTLGMGTNVLVLDGGIRGVTLSLREAFNSITKAEETQTLVRLLVGTGILKSKLLDYAIDEGLTGLEFSAGVPGTLGGGVYMNAGTKYGSYGDVIKKIKCFDFATGTVFERLVSNKDFAYRNQSVVTPNILVLETLIELTKGDREDIRIQVQKIIEERKAKQPLDFPSCGSTFKNPPGLSAGRLIEQAGLKGLRVGGAMVSNKHANFILNVGGAKARDIITLIQHIQSVIQYQCGVLLETEVIILGEDT